MPASKNLALRSVLRNQVGAGSIMEFGPVLIVLFLIVLFPLIDLMGLACGTATVFLIARQTAARASEATTYDDALSAVKQEAAILQKTGFAAFAKLSPVGGYSGSGCELYVHRTAIAGGTQATCGPNKLVPSTPAPAIDTNKYLYEYATVVTFDVGPVFANLHSVPFVGNVPGVGAPARLKMTSDRDAEHADGLVGAGGSSIPVGSWF